MEEQQPWRLAKSLLPYPELGTTKQALEDGHGSSFMERQESLQEPSPHIACVMET